MKLTSSRQSAMFRHQLEIEMAVALKQKRSGQRPPSGSAPIVARKDAGQEPAAGEGPGVEKRDRPQDPLLTKIGTHIVLASLIFDGDWYQSEYPDVAAASMDPVKHYFDNGSREGRNPNQYFDTNWYASNNPDVAAAGLNPFLHYLLYGAREGRRPAP